MNFYSTNNSSLCVSFKDAIFLGPAADGGLFMPETIPQMEKAWFDQIENASLTEIGIKIIQAYTDISETDLSAIVQNAFNFPAPLYSLNDDINILELFRGPTLAFKDFGARFMAQIMQYFRPKDAVINILVATSGDTGGAVASAFSGLEGFNVYILYPSGKVSPIQQKQLTTWDTNVTAIEVQGNFDDCQRLVKQAFADQALRANQTFASANSINIARLLPQMVYYFEAYRQLENKHQPVFVVPSGNFGNLTAGLIAQRMGLPIHKFIAATNINAIVPEYLNTGIYSPTVSRETYSNAMDVGNPSNFVRMQALFQGKSDSSTWNSMTQLIDSQYINDDITLSTIKKVYDQYHYILDPHTAVAYHAANQSTYKNKVVLSTAHPAKFESIIHKALGLNIDYPESLSDLMNKKERIVKIKGEYGELRELIG